MSTIKVVARFVYDDGTPISGRTVTLAPVPDDTVESYTTYPTETVTLTSNADGLASGTIPKATGKGSPFQDWDWNVTVQGGNTRRRTAYGNQTSMDLGVNVVRKNPSQLHRVTHDGTSYGSRPSGAAAGMVEYVGPTTPTSWLAGDTWLQTS